MSENENQNGSGGWRGWVVVGVSLGVLFCVAMLKGSADSGGELDD
jgi:hypothetical protein